MSVYELLFMFIKSFDSLVKVSSDNEASDFYFGDLISWMAGDMCWPVKLANGHMLDYTTTFERKLIKRNVKSAKIKEHRKFL